MNTKVSMWSAAGLIAINLAVIAIVAFLIYRDSTQSNYNHLQSEQRQ